MEKDPSKEFPNTYEVDTKTGNVVSELDKMDFDEAVKKAKEGGETIEQIGKVALGAEPVKAEELDRKPVIETIKPEEMSDVSVGSQQPITNENMNQENYPGEQGYKVDTKTGNVVSKWDEMDFDEAVKKAKEG